MCDKVLKRMAVQNYINGQWVNSSRSQDAGFHKPATIWVLESGHADDRLMVESALEGARLSHEQITKNGFFKLPERLSCFQKIIGELKNHKKKLAQVMAAEIAKPIQLAEAEIDRGILTIEATIKAAESLLGLQPVSQISREAKQMPTNSVYEIRKPQGVVFCITPFNFPINLVIHKIAPALISGCPVILKASPKSSNVTLELCKIFESAGFPAGMLNVLHLDHELTQKICQDKRIFHVSFTGSDKVGWHLKKIASCPVTLELGGNASTYIHKDALLKKAAFACTQSAFSFAGQSCISLQNLFVHQNVYDNFRALMIQNLHQLKWGASDDHKNTCSWVIDPEASARIKQQIQSALSSGATICASAEPPVGWTWNDLEKHPTAVAPTIIEHISTSHSICSQEIFGPVVILHKVESEQDYIDWCHSATHRLQTSIWSADTKWAAETLSSFDFGGVLVNESVSFRCDAAPYGGQGLAGLGTEGPCHVIKELTRPSTLVIGGL